jgi:hypothetical protein
MHTTLPSGLTLDEYALQRPPALDPLDFTLVRGTLADILARHAQDGGAIVPRNEANDAQGPYLSTEWHGQTLIAREIFTTTPTGGVVDVLVGSRKIYRLPIGDVSPLTPLQQLFTYDGHWLLEAALVTHSADTLTNIYTLTATGQIVEDGVLLNARDGYQAAFGLQLLRGKPFYFYQQAGQIGMAYDGHNTLLGYDAIPHYGCCSGAELNPRQRENMVAFFAQKGAVWYYVEIGRYGP